MVNILSSTSNNTDDPLKTPQTIGIETAFRILINISSCIDTLHTRLIQILHNPHLCLVKFTHIL